MKSCGTVELALLTACVSLGQPLPQFDAASVKPAGAGDIRGSAFQFTPGGGLTITNGTLRGILETAYGLRDFQIVGGPGWLNSDRWEIFARAACRRREYPSRRRPDTRLHHPGSRRRRPDTRLHRPDSRCPRRGNRSAQTARRRLPRRRETRPTRFARAYRIRASTRQSRNPFHAGEAAES